MKIPRILNFEVIAIVAILLVSSCVIHAIYDGPFQPIGNDFYVYQYQDYVQENITLHDGTEHTIMIANVSEIHGNQTKRIIVSNENIDNFSKNEIIVYNKWKTDIGVDVTGYMYQIQNEV